MGRTGKMVLGGGIAVVAVLALLAGAVWYFVLRDDSPPEVSLAGALDSIASATAASNSGAGSDATTTPSGSTSSSTGLSGTWAPDTSQTTFLGYRVVEELAKIGSATAVGRTTSISGTVVIDGNSLTIATITADMTKLKSDSDMRDGQLRNQAIEYSKYPSATFQLSEAVSLPATLASGGTAEVTLKGKLTLHGVTKDVSIPVQAQLKDGLLVVVGSTKVLFSDYSIAKPQGASVLSIEDSGILEIQLILKKASAA